MSHANTQSSISLVHLPCMCVAVLFAHVQCLQLNGNGIYLGGDDNRMTVQVEWLESQLLFHEKWQLVDNVVVQHKHQMWWAIHY